MTNQPSQGPDYQGNGSPWPGHQPPAGNNQGQYGPPDYGRGSYGQGRFGTPQYGQPQYNQAPYNQAQYDQAQYFGQQAYYGRPEPKTLSIASMVCGIASVIMGWLVLPQVAAIITGHLALRREPSGRGMSISGLVLGYLCLLGYGALWLLLIIGLAVASTSGSNSGGTF
ncbi:DUF4190 domain-containing protein [Pseudarthrobacter sp. NPDC080039]|uniref:DUF4190 domain-containing protein n=1 Tax=unclassified Pseudarthrobacter TaxID=2647000 RepID=UPI00344E5906